jgi:hypothetical protein
MKLKNFFFFYEDGGHVVGNKVSTWFNIIKLNFIWGVNNTVCNSKMGQDDEAYWHICLSIYRALWYAYLENLMWRPSVTLQ